MLLVTVFWGLTFPLIRQALETLSPPQFVALRFSLATLAFLPLLLGSRKARAGLSEMLLPGLILGAIAWASYFSQTLGLQTVGAGRAAFITGLNVILVPLLSPLFRAGRPSRLDVVAAVVATGGMYLLTDPRAGGITGGDLWILSCALSYAVYIHALQIALRRCDSATALAFAQVGAIALLSLLYLPTAGVGMPALSGAVWIALLFCALFATVGTFWLQANFQSQTTPERVALIFSLEPVTAAIFAYWLLGETLSTVSIIGAVVIFVAVLGAELLGGERNGGADR